MRKLRKNEENLLLGGIVVCTEKSHRDGSESSMSPLRNAKLCLKLDGSRSALLD